jgi:plastocyanin
MPQLTRCLAIVVAMLILALPATANAEDPSAPTVSTQDFMFNPAGQQASPGATVTWTFDGASPHTVTADDGSFDSGILAQGSTFTMTFQDAGTYAYYCALHGAAGGVGMSGTIVVGG